MVVARTPTALDGAARARRGEQRGTASPARLVDAAGLRELEPHLAPRLRRRRVLPRRCPGPADAGRRPGCCRPRVDDGASCGWAPRSPVSARGRAGRCASRTRPGPDRGRLRRQRGRHLGRASWPSAFGAPVPVLPRRGFILVTEPLPPVIRHKVYSADYVANVASSAAGLETSSVIEGTPIGHRADRRQPRTGRLQPHDLAAGRAAVGRRRPSSCSRCCATST